MRLFFVIFLTFLLLPLVRAETSSDKGFLQYPSPSSHQGEAIESQWQNIIDVCVPYGLDPYIIAALVKIESWFDPNAYNEAERRAYESGYPTWYGEYYGKGLMQLTGPWTGGVPFPSEVEWIYNMPPNSRPGEAPRMDNAYDARQNLNRGCWYFTTLVDYYRDDINKALTAYNRGWQRVDDGSVNPSTFAYTQQVLSYYHQYQDDVADKTRTTAPEQNAPISSPKFHIQKRSQDGEETAAERWQRIEQLRAEFEEPEAETSPSLLYFPETNPPTTTLPPQKSSRSIPFLLGGMTAILLTLGIFLFLFLITRLMQR